jgi:thiol peroxidase
MPKERFGLIQFEGVDRTVIGPDIRVGEVAPDFVAVAQDWSEVRPISAEKGKVRILAAALSLDTSVCDRETRRFNEEAASLGQGVRIYVLSADLPWTQKRWCGAVGVDRVSTLSDAKYMDFGSRYGCLIKETRFLRRAVFVVDRDNLVVYSDYMPKLGDEPKYDEVLAAARRAL